MKKKLKRLLTGMLTLATVFTTLPASTVHASEKQYWTDTEEKAGYVEKVMNDGSIGSTFHEGIMTMEGETVYCVDINMAKQAIVKVFNTIMTRAGITLIVSVAFSISSMFYNISTDYPYGYGKRACLLCAGQCA